MSNVQVEAFPLASVAVKVTVVGPIGSVAPTTGDCVITIEAAKLQLSVTVIELVKSVMVYPQEASAFTVVFAGHPEVIVGGVPSAMITWKVQVEEFPA